MMRVTYRFYIILVVGLIECWILFSLRNDFIEYFSQLHERNYSWLGPSIAMIIASPVAFLIWAFRNADKEKDLLHAEENIRQIDFHKIEEWATTFSKSTYITTAAKPDLSNGDVNVIQIAAIFQLLPFLRGDYGKRFFQPTREIYRSLLSSWTISSDDDDRIKKFLFAPSLYPLIKPDYIDVLNTIISNLYLKDIRIMQYYFFPKEPFFFSDSRSLKEVKEILLSGFDLKCTQFQSKEFYSIDLSDANLSYCILSDIYFNKSMLQRTKFNGSTLRNVLFQNSFLHFTDFSEANFFNVFFRDAVINPLYFKKAKFKKISFKGMDLQNCCFINASFNNVNFENVNFEGAIFILSEETKDCFNSFAFGSSTTFEGAEFEDSDFSDTNMSRAIFIDATFIKVNFKNAGLKGIDTESIDFVTNHPDITIR